MQLAVFGGTFDPPHNGHLALCLYARELLPINRLVISVSNNPLKESPQSTDRDRVRMAGLLAETVNRTGAIAEVCSWEVDRAYPSYTIDLVTYLEEIYSSPNITLLIGEDNYRNFRHWKSWEELIRRCNIVVFSRESAAEEASLEKLHEQKFHRIDFNLPLSSTDIRDRIASGEDCSQQVPASIWRYIVEEGLYRSTEQ
ncbi:nicotinate (nicotinamide) nucleotide adenylyltransferase [Prosthecochloris sp. SCSIO W1101]|uniref:nicotinate (nicotinamide) nucleotide adenylyltransferase n=1 Tax=Prosthecochloris sp. SCSIO W1101 TaxID=2992242 RepID=UPI00223D9F81|nr:nicotinate (nicotinamide) nucleotide adenylyltransferase [Prosthecochloris sp. SCSIO W1101]UZJ41385.1 nicotinate (nicotinamide) nucleotide adenylyltransferase [Prosthecochloris sp. SCSIO W1101]